MTSEKLESDFVPQIGMYIRINMSKTDFIYLKIWCNSVIFCQRGYLFWLTLYVLILANNAFNEFISLYKTVISLLLKKTFLFAQYMYPKMLWNENPGLLLD